MADDDTFNAWVKAVLEALHTGLLLDNRQLNPRKLWLGLLSEAKPKLEKYRTYWFFYQGSFPAKMNPANVAHAILMAAETREQRERKDTPVVPMDARERAPDESPLPMLSDDTLIDEIVDLSEAVTEDD